jgi:hypothetical protein
MTAGRTGPRKHIAASANSVLWVTAHDGRERSKAGRRFRRATDLAWSPVDAVLAARDLSNLVVVAATLGMAALCLREGGLDGLIVNVPGLAVIWSAIYGLIRLGRRWRDVHPPEHETRRH